MSLRDFDIIEDVKPIGGGWRYMQVQRDGSLQRIPANGASASARKLVEMVRLFRVNEGILLGDYERDIAEYIRKVSPGNDRFRGKGGVLNQPRPEPFIPLIHRLRTWLIDLSPQKPRLLTAWEATERANACVKCPQNIRWKTDCGECNKEVEYLSRSIRALSEYPLDDALHGCRIHGTHLPCAVFIDRDNLSPKLPTAPAECWMPTRD